MKPCCVKGCKNMALVVPKIRIPAMGWPLDAHSPIGMICDIPHCPKHVKKLKAKKFLADNPNIRHLVGILTSNKCPPDFKRAFVEWVPMVSSEYGDFLRLAEAKGVTNP